jgi:hypothetical protein
MRLFTSSRILGAAAAISLSAGCASVGPSAVASRPIQSQAGSRFLAGPAARFLNPARALVSNAAMSHSIVSHDSCPATGPIRYVSDYANSVIDIYAGKFAGQAPCGQITTGIAGPEGIFVRTATHDLYVANDSARDILVFHRGQTSPYNTYTDPTVQDTFDVTVAKDGTVIASNLIQPNGNENGSISTWIGGPNGGTFVGNFPMTNDSEGLFLTVQKNGKVYYNDVDAASGQGVLWTVSCPAGACGAETQVAGVAFTFPFGMGSDNGQDLLVNDLNPTGGGLADTFELPNPKPKSFPLLGIPIGMAINPLDHHWFVADAMNDDAAEYSYPGGTLIGTVPGNSGGDLVGIALDPGHALK